MLKPAILYKEELNKLFAEIVYSEDYFLYSGYLYCHELPEIKVQDNHFQYVILGSSDKIIGYLAYYIDINTDCVSRFGLISFDKGNPVLGKDLWEEMSKLVQKHHRIEWRMIVGNPVQKSYDRFCKLHHGNRVCLHDVCKDLDGNYRDEYIYEIVKGVSYD